MLAYWLASTAYGPLIGFLVCTPALGALAAWWLLHRGAGLRYWLRWHATREVNGRYHAFNDVGVRIGWEQGRCLVAAADVLRVLQVPLDAAVRRRLALRYGPAGFFVDRDRVWWFDETALLDWLASRGAVREHQDNRLRLWLEREAFPAMHRAHRD